jgi:hypothetical protein
MSTICRCRFWFRTNGWFFDMIRLFPWLSDRWWWWWWWGFHIVMCLRWRLFQRTTRSWWIDRLKHKFTIRKSSLFDFLTRPVDIGWDFLEINDFDCFWLSISSCPIDVIVLESYLRFTSVFSTSGFSYLRPPPPSKKVNFLQKSRNGDKYMGR